MRRAEGSQAQDFVEDALSDFGFAELGQREVTAIAGEERDDVGVVVEAGAFGGDVIGDDEVCVFRGELFARVVGDLICLGGEAYDEAIAFCLGGFGENIGRRLKAKRHRLLEPFDFLRLRFGGAVVGDSRREDRNGG